jgi:hypothetical protein
VPFGAPVALLLGLTVCIAWNAALLAVNLWPVRRIAAAPRGRVG